MKRKFVRIRTLIVVILTTAALVLAACGTPAAQPGSPSASEHPLAPSSTASASSCRPMPPRWTSRSCGTRILIRPG